MANVKFSDIINHYVNYNNSGEFTVWVEKLELVAKLQEVEDMLKFVPLFLSGPAFAVYQQLSDATKKDYGMLKAELTVAFSTNAFASYEQLRSRVLLEGESVDVYLADLRRLVTLMGQRDADPLLRCAFVAGLPEDVAMQLKSTVDINKMDLASLVSKARAMLANKSLHSSAYVCLGTKDSRQAGKCYNCQGMGHMARDCPSSKQSSFVQSKQRRIRRCYVCNSDEHLANKCPQRQGNDQGGAYASDAHPKTLQ